MLEKEKIAPFPVHRVEPLGPTYTLLSSEDDILPPWKSDCNILSFQCRVGVRAELPFLLPVIHVGPHHGV